MTTADAWLLRRRAPGEGRRAAFERATIDIGSLAPDEALVAPLYGSWEANMSHALSRSPVDVCAERREDAVVIGNAAVVRVLEVGRQVTEAEPGQLAMLHGAGLIDELGYVTHALGFDAPGQMGCLATRMRLKGRQLIALPEGSRHTAPQWAAFAVRYVTAWANWRVALGVARLFHDAESRPALNVWGWGGGTTLAELDLAHREGHRTAMLAGRDSSLEVIEKLGIDAVDRRDFGGLRPGPADPGASGSAEERKEYRAQLRAYTAEVLRRTDGEGVHIFVDYIGEPVWRATLRALSRQAVVTTAGWKHGMRLDYLRAVECIAHHQFVHTHFSPRADAVRAVAFGEATGWAPAAPDRMYSFDEVPDLAEAYEAGATGYFPCFEIAP